MQADTLLLLLAVLVSFLSIAVLVLGFVFNGIKGNQKDLWLAHNSHVDKAANFREEVKEYYLRKDDMEEHVSLRLDSLNDCMERVEAQLEKIQPTMAGLNQSIPGLVKVMGSIDTKLSQQHLNG